MIAIFDNLNALILLSAVILSLMFLRTRMVEHGIEQTSTYMMKKQAVDMAVWLEDDLLTVGLNMDVNNKRFENPVQDGLVTRSFTFYRDTIDTATGTRVNIATRYDLADAGTRTLSGQVIDVYTLTRYVKVGSGTWKAEGGSSSLLSHFRIDMLNANAIPVGNPSTVAETRPDSIRNTRVRFALVTPFEVQNGTLNKVYYGSTLMLPNYN